MTTPELLEFIRIEHALGMSLSEIANLLTSEGGWDMADVAEAYRALGLPEEAIESFSATPKTQAQENLQILASKAISDTEIIKHAPEPTMAQGPSSVQFKQRPAPMHYVEKPEEVKKPTLARPASLKGQVSRNLVRTVSSAASFAKVEKPKSSSLGGQFKESASISEIATTPSSVSTRSAAGPATSMGAPLPKPKELHGSINDIENALSVGISEMEIPKEEPKPKAIVTPVQPEKKEAAFDISKIKIAEGGEIVEKKKDEEVETVKPIVTAQNISQVSPEIKPKSEEVTVVQKEEIKEKIEEKPVFAKVEEKPSGDFKFTSELTPLEKKAGVTSSPEEQMKAMEAAASRMFVKEEKIEEKKVEPSIEVKKVEEMIVKTEGKIEEKMEASQKIEEKKEEIVQKLAEPALFVKAGEQPIEVKPSDVMKEITPPLPNVPPQAQPGLQQPNQNPPQPYAGANQMQYGMPWQTGGQMQGQPPYGMPPYGQPYGQPYGMPPQMMQQPYYPQPEQPVYAQPPQIIVAAPTSPQPQSMLSREPRTEEIGSVAPDIEEQAYLAQFGQAKMPEGIVRPQPTVISPTIIYTQQVVAPSAQVAPEQAEEKKPEPMRFDIGKVRTSKKMDQTSYSDRPSIVSAVSGMKPVESKTIEESFVGTVEKAKTGESQLSTQNKEIISSLKVPGKRTMFADMAKLEEGILPGQVVAPSTKEGDLNTINQIESVVEEEPLPPPPPKKANKSVLIITLSIIGVVLLGGAIAYYLIVLRLPSSNEVYSNAMKVLLRGPAISYDAKLAIAATSTDAEPEYLNLSSKATGTLSISQKAFLNGKHNIDFSINHSGVTDPVNFTFNGTAIVVGDDVYISQNSPSIGTQMENLLRENEWLKTPYSNIGEILGLTTSKTQGDGYENITQQTSLFKILVTNSPVVVNGELSRFIKDGREFYRIPIKIDSKKAILDNDLLSKYLRGSASVPTTAERVSVLEKRYDAISGELIVDKLLMRPIKVSLSGVFDPAKIPLKGEMKFEINFEFLNQDPVIEAKGKSFDDIKALRLEETVSASVIAKDAPVKAILPVIKLALKQYAEKFGRYPLSLNDLILAGFLGEGSLSSDIQTKVFYSSYVDKPKDTVSGVRCTAKNIKCTFYHLGVNLEFRKSSELDADVDMVTAQINGSDDTGCHNESNMSCLDNVEQLTTGNQ